METTSITATFIPQEKKPEPTKVLLMSGEDLRRHYVTIKYRDLTVERIENKVNPSCITEESEQILVREWYEEAKVLYPKEGDYRVKTMDKDGNPIPIGQDIEWIIEANQVLPDDCQDEIPNCPGQIVVIQICNSNAQTDDNFEVSLNGTVIGNVDLSTAAQVGSVFIASMNTNLAITNPDFSCPMNQMVRYNFPTSVLKSVNTLKLKNIKNNGMSNAGSIGIRSYTINGSQLVSPCVLGNYEYTGQSGRDFEFSFNYTDCCGQNT